MSFRVWRKFLTLKRPPKRTSRDTGCNRFGDHLLDFCKSMGTVIVNGKFSHDNNIGKLTLITHNGQSTVEYLLTYTHNFTCLTDFNVHDFLEFSNHAPLSFSFKTKLVKNCSKSSSCTYYKWDNTFKTSFLNDISNGIETLKQNSLHEIDNHSNCDELLSQFTDFLCKCGNKYFGKHSSKKDTF